jgi:hypothetical protein
VINLCFSGLKDIYSKKKIGNEGVERTRVKAKQFA